MSIQGRLESLGFGLYLGEIESEEMSTGWSGTAPIIRCSVLLHPLVGLPHVCKDDYGAKGVIFKPLVSSEDRKSLGCLIYTVSLELGSCHGDEAALPLRASPAWH